MNNQITAEQATINKSDSIKLVGECRVIEGDCRNLLNQLEDNSIDVIVTSPPYWGQRTSGAVGVEEDPRDYLKEINDIFISALRVLKPTGCLWINIGDAYDTPVNWSENDHTYSSLGADKSGLSPENSAYKKNRAKRKAFIDKKSGWLKYGNLLALPYRMVIALCDAGYYYRGEVIWKKMNPLPEGRCRRPHRVHESIYLMAKQENHQFSVAPPVKSVWEFANEGRKEGVAHFSRFPEELPRRCIEASGVTLTRETVILDPFAGSGTTGVVAARLGCSFIGFEIDSEHAKSANKRIQSSKSISPLFK